MPPRSARRRSTVGLASAMRADDVLLPTYREHGAQLWRGVSLVELLLYWGGDERGSDFAGPRERLSGRVPIASQCLHAAGAALPSSCAREPRVAVCVFGDGATSKGDFYEAINIAGVWRVPAVFVISNNQWAISVPRSAQSRDRDAGPEGDRRRHPRRAGRRQRRDRGASPGRARARAGARRRGAERGRGADLPAVRPHHGRRRHAATATASEVSAQWANEPIARLRSFLGEAGLWTKADEERLIDELQPRDRRCGRALPGDAGASADGDVRPPLRRAAGGAGRPAHGGGGGSEGGDHA